ncbi:MAG: hypothetical protein ABI562_07230 [Chloroflexota bacterium]
MLRPAALAALLLIVSACTGSAPSGPPTASVGPSSPPSGSPSSSPSVGAIEHATGATDVVLRYEESGGLMMPGYTAAQAPIFTLYGDGTIIFRNPTKDLPPAVGSVMPFQPFRTAKMDEPQIQSLLEFAIGPGGLGAARADYPNNMVMDAPSAIFTIAAGGVTKTVTVAALGIDNDQVPDLLARKAFVALRDHLVDIDDGGSIKTDLYAPERYRAILLEGQPGAPDQKAWPWKDIKPSDFVNDGAPDVLPLPARVMTVAEIEGLGIAAYQGGFAGLPLAGPGDGKFYSLNVRPLLPDDKK